MDNIEKNNYTTNNIEDYGLTNPYQVLVDTIKNPFEFKQVNQQFQQEEEINSQILSTQINKDNFPKFFKYEKNYSLIKLLFSLFVMLGSIIGLLVIVLNNYHFHTITNFIDNGYYALVVLLFIPSFLIFTFSLINYHFIKKEYKSSLEKFDSNFVSNIIQRIYKKIFISNINLNWFVLYIFITSLFIILLVFIITYFKGIWVFGGQNAPSFGCVNSNEWFIHQYSENLGIYPQLNKIVIIVVCSVTGFLFIYQVFVLITNNIRIKRIDSTYTTNILSEDEIAAIKHSANIRNLIIFCVLTIVMGLVLLLVYFLLKRKK